MSTRRSVILAIGVGSVMLPLLLRAQRPEKVHRIGILLYGSERGSFATAFKGGLRDLGYVEGRNIVFEERTVGGELGRFSGMAAELLRLNVDVLVTTNARAAQAAAKITKTVPILVAGAGDLVGTGLAVSLSKPGRNVTGLTALSPELSAKRLQLLKEVVPGVKRVAVLWNPDGPSPMRAFKETLAASRVLGLEIHSLEVRAPGDIERAFAGFAQGRAQGMLVIADPLIAGNVRTIVDRTVEGRIPAVFPWKEFVDAGGLMAYGPNYVVMYRRAADYVDRILKGASASELSIEQPTMFEMQINAKTAKVLGISISMPLRSRADLVIE